MNENFKKDLTWDNFKVGISAAIPMLVGAWIYTKWFEIINKVLNEYISKPTTPVTEEQIVIVLCLAIAMVAPIWPLLVWSADGGMKLGRAIGFFKDDKTRRLWWDNKTYFVRDMPEEKRKQIAEILSEYKSKGQLRKERLANKSWLRRTFT